MTNYMFVTDPGHGWLQVTVTDLVEAINDGQGFSSCSYASLKTGMIYLEEDIDAGTFLAWRHPDKDYKLETRHSDEESFVRNLPHLIDTRKQR